MPDPMKFQRALFPEMEPRTIIVSKGGVSHRCFVIWCDKITDEIRKRVRGKNSKLFISMHTSHSEPTDKEIAWDTEASWENWEPEPLEDSSSYSAWPYSW